MTKKILLLVSIALGFIHCRAQQVFECPEFGFKFVIGYQFDGYTGNTIPLITYVAKGSPADAAGMIAGTTLIDIAGTKLMFPKNVSGLEVLNRIKNRDYDFSLVVHTTTGWNQQGELYVNMENYQSAVTAFPQAKQAPVAGGKNLLGTCVSNCKEDIKTILYENGDIYTGQVVNKVYPDPKYAGGRYITLEEYIKPLKEQQQKKEAENAAAQKAKAEAKAEMEKKAQELAVQYNEKQRQDSILNGYTLTQIIDFIYPDIANRPMLYGIGIDVKKENGLLTVTEVKPGSSAWFYGIKEGDVLESINGMPTGNMSKLDVITKIIGSLWSEVTVEISRKTEHINLQKVFPKCYTVYYKPASFTHGCLYGNCENGDGVYMDEKGVLYKGVFVNRKLNCTKGGEVVNAADKTYAFSNYINGKKNGFTIIYNDRGIISYTFPSSTVNTVGYQGQFTNDVPDGKGILQRGFSDYYNVNYANGVLQGKALKVIDPQHYRYCDVTARFEPVNCKDFTGTPPDVSMLPAGSTSSASPHSNPEDAMKHYAEVLRKNNQKSNPEHELLFVKQTHENVNETLEMEAGYSYRLWINYDSATINGMDAALQSGGKTYPVTISNKNSYYYNGVWCKAGWVTVDFYKKVTAQIAIRFTNRSKAVAVHYWLYRLKTKDSKVSEPIITPIETEPAPVAEFPRGCKVKLVAISKYDGANFYSDEFTVGMTGKVVDADLIPQKDGWFSGSILFDNYKTNYFSSAKFEKVQ